MANYSPPLVDKKVLQDAANRLLELYPDIPALGSPFNTGNETFGLPSGYKRESAIVEFHLPHLVIFTFYRLSLKPDWRSELRLATKKLDASCKRSWSEDLWLSLYSATTLRYLQ